MIGYRKLYHYFRSGGIYKYMPRGRINAAIIAYKYWRKGSTA
jgi:hypothetical protein